MKLIKQTLTAFAVTMASVAAMAAEYQIDVSGTLDLSSAPSIYGIVGGVGLTTPVDMSISIDTNLGAVTAVPAGTAIEVSGSNVTFDTNVTFVPKAAIKNFGLVIGTGSWLTQEIIDREFNNGQVYGLLLGGDLVNGAVGRISLLVDGGAGQVSFGDIICSPVCNLNGNGFTTSYTEFTSGSIYDITATVTEINVALSTEQQVTNLADKIAATTYKKAVKIVLGADIKLTQLALKKNKPVVAKAAMNAFIKVVTALSGKSIPTADADSLILDAQNILASMP